IAVSTVISAINAVTMTPSRAVLLFQPGVRSQESGVRKSGAASGRGVNVQPPAVHGQGPLTPDSCPLTPEREALPWWIFAVAGGLLTFWYSTPLLGYLHDGLQYLHLRADWVPRPRAGEDAPAVSRGRWWLLFAAYFAPGALAGGLLGRAFIRPVNAVLGRLFRDFNRAFDFMAAGYGWVVGKLLPVNVVVLGLYAGLLGLTW